MRGSFIRILWLPLNLLLAVLVGPFLRWCADEVLKLQNNKVTSKLAIYLTFGLDMVIEWNLGHYAWLQSISTRAICGKHSLVQVHHQTRSLKVQRRHLDAHIPNVLRFVLYNSSLKNLIAYQADYSSNSRPASHLALHESAVWRPPPPDDPKLKLPRVTPPFPASPPARLAPCRLARQWWFRRWRSSSAGAHQSLRVNRCFN